jgi:hypothetical protein
MAGLKGKSGPPGNMNALKHAEIFRINSALAISPFSQSRASPGHRFAYGKGWHDGTKPSKITGGLLVYFALAHASLDFWLSPPLLTAVT